MAKKLPQSINLLEPVFAPDDIWDQLYYWVFNVGKYLFVVVEIAVLAVFISRFLIDRKNNDLTEQVNQRVDLLSEEFFRESTIKYENLHSLLADLRVASDNQVINSKLIASVRDGLPSNITLERFSFSSGQISMAFTASDFASISNFEKILGKNDAYNDVTVRLNKTGEISSNIDFTVSFVINSDALIEDGPPKN